LILIYLVEIEYETSLSNLEIEKAKALAKIEADKFQEIVAAIGQDTLVAISNVKVKSVFVSVLGWT